MTAEESAAFYAPKHTPGPWEIPTPSFGFSAITTATGDLIFGLAAGAPDEKQSDDVCEANARLISAAPDLLADLQDMLETFGLLAGDVTDPDQSDQELVLVKRVRATIAKATGA